MPFALTLCLVRSQALAPEQKLTYKEGGPAAEARFEGGVAGFEARSFRGCGIMTSEPFEVSDDNESLQMLTRNSQIGEFYVMSPPQVPPQGDSTMYTCDIMIFDEERDAHVRISWNEALKATLCSAKFDENGKMSEPSPFLTSHNTVKLSNGAAGKKLLTEWAAAAAAWADFNSKKDGDYETTVADHGKDVRIIVARPFIEHAMHNVIMAVAGRDVRCLATLNSVRVRARAAHTFPLLPADGRHAVRPGGHAALGQVRTSAWPTPSHPCVLPCSRPLLFACSAPR